MTSIENNLNIPLIFLLKYLWLKRKSAGQENTAGKSNECPKFLYNLSGKLGSVCEMPYTNKDAVNMQGSSDLAPGRGQK